jgi:hypothetical protein
MSFMAIRASAAVAREVGLFGEEAHLRSEPSE